MASPGSIYRHFSSKFPAPKQGSLRIWWIPQIPMDAFAKQSAADNSQFGVGA